MKAFILAGALGISLAAVSIVYAHGTNLDVNSGPDGGGAGASFQSIHLQNVLAAAGVGSNSIGCGLTATDNGVTVTCTAADVTENRFGQCTDTAPTLEEIYAVKSINSSTNDLEFGWDANNNCTFISVQNAGEPDRIISGQR